MKVKLNRILVAVAMLTAGVLWAQDKKTVPPPPVKRIPVYLGNSGMMGGVMSKKQFDQLLQLGLTSKDSLGKSYQVEGFMLTYAERNLYEDSIGNLMYMTDLFSESFKGDTVSSYWLSQLKDRSKTGDTVYIDQITVRSPEGTNEHGKGMRIVITK